MQINLFYYYVYILFGVGLLFFLNRVIKTLKAHMKPKILVKYYRMGEQGYTFMKKPYHGNVITIKAGSRGRGLAPITAKFTNTSIIEEPYMLGLLKRRFVIFVEGANRCLDFAIDKEKAPNITQEGVREYSKLSAIYRAGTVHQKVDYNIVSIATLLIVIFLLLRSLGMIA